MAIKNLRWWIAGLLALATALNYLDRQSFPVVVGEVRKEIPMDDDQYGRLTSLFLFAYAIMYAGGGCLMDWLGTRLGYAVMIVWWSAANMLTGTVHSLLGLGSFRFLLGMGEGGGFPGSAKAVAEWFPARERSLAFGIFNAGSSIGAMVAPPLIAPIVSTLGWRWVFYLTGGMGLLWVMIWLWLYRPPETNPLITEEERALIAHARETDQTAGDDSSCSPVSWLRLFAFPEVRILMLAKFLTDAAWYFFLFWLPKYLGDVRHLNIKEIGAFAWIPYALSGGGSLIGGWIGARLLSRHYSLNVARKVGLAIGAALMPVSLFIVASPLSYAIVFYSTAMFAHQFWSATIQTLPADLFPPRLVGSVHGLLGSAGSFGGMFFGLIVGRLIGHAGYGPAFLIAGVLHPLAFVIILLAMRRITPVPLGSPA